METKFSVVILAAGKGTRMRSDFPKVLHVLAGKPMVKHVIDNVATLNPEQIHLVYGFGGDLLKEKLNQDPINWVYQEQQLGTGHAMQQVAPFFADNEVILMLYGDGPLITAETLATLIHHKPENGIALLTVTVDNPYLYGRIIRDKDGNVLEIVEEKDATEEQRAIKEINTGVMVADGKNFKQWLSQLTNNNAQNEYYITDLIGMANNSGCKVVGVEVEDVNEVLGVNDRLQLMQLERYYQTKQAEKLLLSGVMIRDINRFDLRGELNCGRDVEIDINVIIEGKVNLGDRVKIGAGCILKDCSINADVQIKPYSIIEDSQIDIEATVGPFSRLRPGTQLASKTHIGNFVELKKAIIGEGSKINHLSYVGDSEVGKTCNIGAGVITCNYDGANKFKTTIGDNVFVGSDVQLVAPVVINNGATIGAGTTITKDVAENELAISRTPQRNIKGWVRPVKK